MKWFTILKAKVRLLSLLDRVQLLVLAGKVVPLFAIYYGIKSAHQLTILLPPPILAWSTAVLLIMFFLSAIPLAFLLYANHDRNKYGNIIPGICIKKDGTFYCSACFSPLFLQFKNEYNGDPTPLTQFFCNRCNIFIPIYDPLVREFREATEFTAYIQHLLRKKAASSQSNPSSTP